MKKSPNAEFWKLWGVTPEGMKLGDKIMPLMLEAVAMAGSGYLSDAIHEAAVYQVYDLPKRTKAMQKKMKWK